MRLLRACLLVCVLCATTPVAAEDACVTLDFTGWSQSDLNLVQNVGDYLGYHATPAPDRPAYQRPTRPRTNRLCYTDPAFDETVAITPATIQAQIAADEARAEDIDADRVALRASARTKLEAGDPLTRAEIRLIKGLEDD